METWDFYDKEGNILELVGKFEKSNELYISLLFSKSSSNATQMSFKLIIWIKQPLTPKYFSGFESSTSRYLISKDQYLPLIDAFIS